MSILKRPHNIPAVPVASQVLDDDGKLTQEFVHFLRAVADLVREIQDIEVLARTSDWRAPVQAEITVDSDLLPVPDGTVNLGGAGATFHNAYLAGVVQADGGFNTSGTASNIIQAPNGGVYGKQIATDTAVYMLPNSSAPTASTSTYGGLGYKTGSTYWYWDGSMFSTVNLATAGGTPPPGSDKQIAFNASNVWAASASLNWDYNNARLGIGTASPTSPLHVVGIPTFASDSAAGTAGLTAGAFWKDSTGNLHVKL